MSKIIDVIFRVCSADSHYPIGQFIKISLDVFFFCFSSSKAGFCGYSCHRKTQQQLPILYFL